LEFAADTKALTVERALEQPLGQASLETQIFPWLKTFAPTRNVLLLGISLCVLQTLDGLLTMIGISRFGIAVEGNPLLQSLMLEYGEATTLAITKIVAIAVVIMLTLMAKRIPWIKNALGALTCVYFFAAVLPWTYLLFVKPYI